GDVYRRMAMLWAQAAHVNVVALAVAAAVLAVTYGAEKISPRIPGALIALVGATLATAGLGLDRRGLPVLGALPEGLPAPSLPGLDFETLLPLVGLATVVALVIMVQTAATTRSFSRSGDPDVNRDFIGA